MGLFGYLSNGAGAATPPPAKTGVNPFQYALDRTREQFFGSPVATPPPSGKAPPRTFGGDMRKAVDDSLAQQYHGGLLAAINPLNSLLATNTLVNGTIHAGSGVAGKQLYHHGIEAATAPLGAGEAEAPVVAADFGPELANVFTRIGRRMANGAGVSEEAAHNQALAYVVQALKKDGAAPQQFADIIGKWQAAGSDAPSLVDALSALPNKGQYTRQVIMDAVPRTELGASMAADYLDDVGSRLTGRLQTVVDSLKPEGASYSDLLAQNDAAAASGAPDAELAGQAEAAQAARGNVTKSPPKFQNALAQHGSQPDAMQAGAYDRLDEMAGGGRQAMGSAADWARPGGDLSQNLRPLFGDKVDLFNQRAANELTRWSNANRLNLGFNPAAAMVPDASMAAAGANAIGKLASDPISQGVAGAGVRKLIPGTLKTDAELANIAGIATGPADAIASLPTVTRVSQPLPAAAYVLPAAAAHVASLPRLTDDSAGSQTAPPQDTSQGGPQPSGAQWPPYPF